MIINPLTSENNYNIEVTTIIEETEKNNEYNSNMYFPDTTQFLFEEINSTEKIEELELYNYFLDNIEQIFTSENYNTSKLDKGEDEYIEFNKILITLTTKENQRNNTNNTLTTIYLEECESSLRTYYNISNTTMLYLKKIDISQEGMKIPKVEYDIYCKLNSS